MANERLHHIQIALEELCEHELMTLEQLSYVIDNLHAPIQESVEQSYNTSEFQTFPNVAPLHRRVQKLLASIHYHHYENAEKNDDDNNNNSNRKGKKVIHPPAPPFRKEGKTFSSNSNTINNNDNNSNNKRKANGKRERSIISHEQY